MHSGSDFKNPSFIVFEDDNELFLLMELPLTKPVVAICLYSPGGVLLQGFTVLLSGWQMLVTQASGACI